MFRSSSPLRVASIEETVLCPAFMLSSKSYPINSVSNSGPVKGYTETLEHRLEEVEYALLRLLLVADNETVEAAFQESHEQAKSECRSEANKTHLVAQWEAFPLQTAQEAKRWANEMSASSTTKHAEYRTGSQSTASAQLSKTVVTDVQRTQSPNLALLSTATPVQNVSTNFAVPDAISQGISLLPELPESTLSFLRVAEIRDETTIFSIPGGSTQIDKHSQERFDLPLGFKKQFLW